MEPFRGPDAPPVLLLINNVDEYSFQNLKKYKDKQFVNIETSFEEIKKDLGDAAEPDFSAVSSDKKLPEEDLTSFCLWLKNELSKHVSKVVTTKRLKDAPAIITGNMSSSMRLMMHMMEQA